MKSAHLPGIPAWLSYGVLCFLSAYATLFVSKGEFASAPLWPAAGFALAGVMLHGYSVLAGVLFGVLLAFLANDLPPIHSAVLALGATLAIFIAGTIVRRQSPAHQLLQGVGQIIKFLLTSVFVAPLFAVLTSQTLLYLDGSNQDVLWQNAKDIWLAHAVGIVLIAPLVIAWRTRSFAEDGWRHLRSLLLALATLLICILLQGQLTSQWSPGYALAYLPFPLIAWAFLGFNARVTTLVLLALTTATIWGSYSATGLFNGSNPHPDDLPMQIYILVLALTALIGSAQVTGRWQRLQRLTLASKVISHSPEGIIVTDPGGVILTANPAFFLFTGFQPSDIAGQSIRKLTSVHHNNDFFTNIWRQLQLNGRWEGEIWNRNKEGEIHPQWLSLTAITDKSQRPTHYLGIYSDVSHHKQVQERLHRLAYHDVLTGLPNRQLFHDRLNQALKYADRKNSRVALFFVDLDRFKNVNDTLGHTIGDKVLQLAAERLNKCLRQTDTLSRFGGDEFTIIIQDVHENYDTVLIAEKVIKAFQTPLLADDHELFMTPSIGIAMFPTDATGSEELIKFADTAMYRAKDLGGNGFQFFASDMSDPVRWNLTIENALRKAIENKNITLEYQPQFDLRTGNIIGLEALARWQHHGLEKTPPDIFISVAEETGLIHRMGDQIIEMACRQASRWIQEGFDKLKVSINISQMQLKQSDFSDRLQQIVRESGANPEHIELEITESTLMENAGYMESLINMLSVQGFRIAIDDFGTGYSSLSYLKRLAIDCIKIDSSFVRDLPGSANDAAICSTIISMAHNLNLNVIAEGVETDEQMEYLRKIHCDEIQGYIFSHPVGPQQISEMIHQGFWHLTRQKER